MDSGETRFLLGQSGHGRAPLRAAICGALAAVAANTLTASAVLVATMATASAQDGAIDEMVVSARFREESLQDTPLAITAVSGAEMELRGLTDVTDLDAFSPSTVIAPLGAGWGSTAAAFIRGVGLGDNSLSFEPGVPIYIDDVYHGRPQGAIMDLLDLERVEVLRGPQGTLFGRNAIGGTVRLVSRKPQGDNSGNIEVQMGSYDQLNVRGGMDVSLVEDQLMLRVSGSSKQRDGYFKLLDYECVNGPGTLGDGGTAPVQVATDIDGAPVFFEPIVLGSELGSQDIRTENGCVVDTLGDENVQSGRAALRWIVSDAMELNVIGDVTRLRQKGPADKYTLINGDFGLWNLWNNAVAGPVYGNDPDGNPIRYDDRFMTDSPYTAYLRYSDDLTNRRWENVNNMDHWGVSGTLDWDLTDTIHLKSVTAFRKFTNTYGRDSDGSPLPLNHTWDTARHRQFTQEIQLTGIAFDDRLDWAFGGFYYDSRDSNQNIGTLAPGPVSNLDGYDVQTGENWALFAHGTFLITDNLNISAGIRYTEDSKEADIYRYNFLTRAVLINHTTVPIDASKWSPKVGIDYRWNDNVMTYFQWATGFRTGGFVPRPQNAFQVQAFGTETMDSYELGWKTQWMDNSLRLNGDIWYAEYQDQQAPDQRCAPCGPPIDNGVFTPWFATGNAGSSKSYGLEFEIQYEPIDRLQLQAAVGYMHYHRYPTPAQVAANQFCERGPDGSLCTAARAPEWTVALGGQYTWLTSDAGSFTLRTDVNYQGEINFNTDPVYGFQGGYTLVNSKLVWNSPDDMWQIALAGNNLTDKKYFHGKLSLVGNLGREQGNVALPRTWNLSVRRNF